jgi:hypothetical protein
MSEHLVDRIVKSVLYEGYMLYPYRRSSLKNQHRWNFGIVYPESMEPSRMQTECLLEDDPDGAVDIQVRFLQVYEKDSWQEVIERTINAFDVGTHPFDFGSVRGDVCVDRELVEPGLHKIVVKISNRTILDNGREPLLQSLVSTHTILEVRGGSFISLLDPPDRFREAALNCRNVGTWPVLVGKESEKKCLLSSPIILYDYPQIAEESPGDLFDCTEIDEILTLRILALTDSEKEEMRHSGERERLLLERVESLTPEELLRLHGTMREPRTGLKRGDRVRLRPRPGGDVFDIVLAGRIAVVESVHQDFEDRTHVAVIIEDDPGKDLGMMRQPGHRFFFSTEELELVP